MDDDSDTIHIVARHLQWNHEKVQNWLNNKNKDNLEVYYGLVFD